MVNLLAKPISVTQSATTEEEPRQIQEFQFQLEESFVFCKLVSTKFNKF